MRFLWLDINSSYSHSSLAIPSLDAQLDSSIRERAIWKVVSGTLSANPSKIILQVINEKPDVIFSTVWLFNSLFILSILKQIKVLLPNVKIILGGPEFLGDNKIFLSENKGIYAVFRGDGEIIYPELVLNLINESSICKLEGVCIISEGRYYDNGKAVIPDISVLKIPEHSEFFSLDKPFVQVETSRGCFNSCKFCVSGCDEKVSYINYRTLKQRLQIHANKGIKEIRILDRTFNAKSSHAINLLKIMKEFHGHLKFHIEFHPALISESLKKELESIPPNLLHIEVGIQSLDDNVIKTAGRKGMPQNSIEGLSYLKNLSTLEIHADLIAGLPGYTLSKLYEDYSTLVKFGVDEIQVETLKLLPGTNFRENSLIYKLKYSPIPPYEILENESITYDELQRAVYLSRISDLWYNDSRWRSVFSLLIIKEGEFLSEFLEFVSSINLQNISPEKCGIILFDFCSIYFPSYNFHISNSWILSGYSLTKKPGKIARKWEKGFSGLPFPFNNYDFTQFSYYYIDSPCRIYWYSFDKFSKTLINYTSLSKM